MELTIKGKTISIWSKKRILYTICFFLFCLIDQRTKTGSGKDGAIEVFRNLTGVVMALIIFSHYKWEEIVARKLPYLLWTVIGVAVGTAVTVFCEWSFRSGIGCFTVWLHSDSYFYQCCHRQKAPANPQKAHESLDGNDASDDFLQK